MAQLSDLMAGEMMDGELFLQEIREALELDNLI
jgi:negative regulator of sigma E activity